MQGVELGRAGLLLLMGAPACSDEEFIAIFRELQSTKAVAERLGIAEAAVRSRRRNMEAKYSIILPLYDTRPAYNTTKVDEKATVSYGIRDGRILVGSDIHLWPGELTTAQRAFLLFAKNFKPDAIILNGDVFDGAGISRYPSIGWEKKPTVQQELEAVQDYLDKLLKASPNSKRFWPAGNHDLRFESKLAAVAPEFAGVRGIHLKDHCPGWIPCWRVDVNDDVVIKHRWANGIHAVYNNTLRSGKTMITGHLHSLKVTPWSDYTGTRYGVDTGTLAEPYGEQFVNYTEASPVNWRSGFVLLTFKDGQLLWPEIIAKHGEDSVQFRGEVVRV
jgi:calcineurin-like phosphoesterase family protein